MRGQAGGKMGEIVRRSAGAGGVVPKVGKRKRGECGGEGDEDCEGCNDKNAHRAAGSGEGRPGRIADGESAARRQSSIFDVAEGRLAAGQKLKVQKLKFRD